MWLSKNEKLQQNVDIELKKIIAKVEVHFKIPLLLCFQCYCPNIEIVPTRTLLE